MAYGNPQGKTASDFSGAAHTTYSITLASAIVSGNGVLGCVGYVGTLTSVTDDKSNTYTLGSTLTTGGSYSTTAFYALGLTNAPITFTANFSGGGGTYTLISADEFSGIASFDVQAGQTQLNPSGTDSVSSGSATTAVNGELIYGFIFATQTGAASTHGTGFAYTAAQASDALHYPEFLTQSSAGAVSATATPSGNDTWNTVLLAFKPAAVGPTTAFVETWS
jgi:hypothetical protein